MFKDQLKTNTSIESTEIFYGSRKNKFPHENGP